MNTIIISIWWRLHHGLLDAEIAASLTAAQRKQLYLNAVRADQRTLFTTYRIWPFLGAMVLLLMFGFLGPLEWTQDLAKQHAGPLGPLFFMWGFIIAGVASGWFFARRLYAKAIYLTVRGFGYDLCSACGYWLRGLDEDVKQCPECGAAREPLLKETGAANVPEPRQ